MEGMMFGSLNELRTVVLDDGTLFDESKLAHLVDTSPCVLPVHLKKAFCVGLGDPDVTLALN